MAKWQKPRKDPIDQWSDREIVIRISQLKSYLGYESKRSSLRKSAENTIFNLEKEQLRRKLEAE